MKVLIVDDEPAIRRFLGEALSSLDYDYIAAEDGVRGLEMVEQEQPDAIISDIKMPKMNGMDFLAELNKDENSPPLVFLTGFADINTATEAIRLGAYDYLTKPVNIDNLDACLLRLQKRIDIQKQLASEKLGKLEAEASAHASSEMKQKVEELNRELTSNLNFMGTLLDAIPNPVVSLDASGKITLSNTAFQKIIAGLEKEELVGLTLVEIPALGDAFKSDSINPATGKPPNSSGANEKRIACADCSLRDYTIHYLPMSQADGIPGGMLCIMTDITERKQIEVQLRQSEKMQAIGQLAAGVAHEINNPVGYIKSNLGTLGEYIVTFKQLITTYNEVCEDIMKHGVEDVRDKLDMLKQMEQDEDVGFIMEDITSLLEESVEGAERVRDIVQSLKSFSRIDDKEMKEVDLNRGIESTLKVVWNELKYKCTVFKNYGQLPLIYCNLGQLNQVFMNLLVNAAHSIEEKGEITISTEADDKNIYIKIADTGCGIPEDVRNRIFDPFFTTKEMGKGTGLGLAISIGIIEEHEGKIELESEVGKGTIFTITLPIRRRGDDTTVSDGYNPRSA